ncbi:hypothetical protein FQN57_005149 [Myotisia sp. PD_48]|nr:hypothetical protein FQN57_005149 [Myotisia sp. PD_48]
MAARLACSASGLTNSHHSQTHERYHHQLIADVISHSSNLRRADSPSEKLSPTTARRMVDQAIAALAVMNKGRIENPHRNKYEWQDPIMLRSLREPAPALDYQSDSFKEHSGSRAKELEDTKEYVYSIPPELVAAARIVAELAPPAILRGNHSLVAAQIQEKYRPKVKDTNTPAQAHISPNGLDGYVPADVIMQDILTANNGSTENLTKRNLPDYWMLELGKRGSSPFAPSNYKVWRNVKDYGAKGDGTTDDTIAINRAIADGNRCGDNCGSSTIYPAVVYFPPGTYLVSSPIIQYYNTQFLGNPFDYPTILGASSFVGLGMITSNVYTGNGNDQWYLNTNNFLRSIKNFKLDIRRTNANAYICAIHWQIAQATSLENIEFHMMQDDKTTQQGIFMENGSGGWMANLTFIGGNFGAYFGNQQFTTTDLAFVNCKNALQIHWDWAWTMHNLIIESCGQGIVVVGGAGGPGSTGQSVGSLTVVDSVIANTATGIITSLYNENSTSVLIQNTGFFNVKTAILEDVKNQVLLKGGNEVMVDSWGFGLLVNSTSTSKFVNGQSIPVMERNETLLGATGYYKKNFFTRRRPTYTDLGMSQIIDVKAAGARGDGKTDDTAILNSVLGRAANMSSVVFFPFGVYVVKDTLRIPVGSRIIGQAWSQIMAMGPKFENERQPRAVVEVGKPGDVGVIEIQDMMFTVSGPTVGAVLVEWNVHESIQGSVAMWDSHFRVGGAIGSNLQKSNCPKLTTVKYNCKAASLLLHITPSASAYLENIWVWVADHDLDIISQDQIDIYSARGVLIESQGPTWLYATASEHNVLYQYQVSQAKNLFMGMIQSESPYYQSTPKAPVPFMTGLFPNDPKFGDCNSSSATCALSWALRIIDSTSIYSLGSGLYHWFLNYKQDCLKTESCQDRSVEIVKSTDVWLYNLVTKGTKEMVSPKGETPTYAKDNMNGFAASILAWVRGKGETIGKGDFRGFQLYKGNDLENVTQTCRNALNEKIGCHPYLVTFRTPSFHQSLSNNTLTDLVCDQGCGQSLKSWFEAASIACANQVLDRAVPAKKGGLVYQGYNETCLRDTKTGKYCNDLFQQFKPVADIRDMPLEEMCSYCHTTRLQMMQRSSYSVYNEDYKSDLELVQKKCSLSGPTDLPPSLYLPEPSTPPICASSETYIGQNGDTCDSIAVKRNVSSASIFMANRHILSRCNKVPVGSELCLPLNCKRVYSLKAGDTCFSIEVAQSMNYKTLRRYNSWLDSDCTNLHNVTEVYGKTLCLDPPGGKHNTTNPTPGTQHPGTKREIYSGYVIPPPANAIIARNTTIHCGRWHLATEGETCAKISIQEAITSDLFLAINPSLSKTRCNSDLKPGLTYCVLPHIFWKNPKPRKTYTEPSGPSSTRTP